MINIDLDAERGRQGQIVTKSITLGELTDSIITKDYGPNPMHPLRTPYMAYLPDSIVTPDQWKYHRRMQQKEAEAAAAAAERTKNSSTGRSGTPDERHIIRMAQPPSPRNKFHELVMSDGHYYQAQQAAVAAAAAGHPGGPGGPIDRRLAGGAGGATHQFALDCYVKNRIVEAMRTEDERRPEESHMHGGHHDRSSDIHRQSTPHTKDLNSDGPNGNNSGSGGGKSTPSFEDGRRSTGGNSGTGGIPVNSQNNDGHGPPHSQYPPPPSQQPPPVTTFAATYAYPFSALNVPGPPPSLGVPPPSTKSLDGVSSQPPSQQSIAAEPKPLLSAQYEALSDEE